MASHGIKDQVAIVGMGCTPFAEHWDKGLDDLIVDAVQDCFASTRATKADIDALAKEYLGEDKASRVIIHPYTAPSSSPPPRCWS